MTSPGAGSPLVSPQNMDSLPEPFLQKLVALLDDGNTLGIVLEGSLARGDGDRFSDIDIYHYLRQMPAGPVRPYSLQVVDGYLVSVSQTNIEAEYASLRIPEQAIWSIPALRQARILLDKDGSLAALQEAARQASWEPLQQAANAYAGWNLSGCGEEVRKVLSGLARQDESKVLYATWSLARGLANALLVQRGAFVSSENEFIHAAQQAAGRDSAWTCQFRRATGLDLSRTEGPAYRWYGLADLALYRESVTILWQVLPAGEKLVVDQTLQLVAEAGY